MPEQPAANPRRRASAGGRFSTPRWRSSPRKGYHGCRIADVAREAGVAYGLVYHYFKNKEELLESVFEESFGRFASSVEKLIEGEGPVAGRLEQIVDFAIDAYQRDPKAVQVLIFEIVRSPAFREDAKRATIQATLDAAARLIEAGTEVGRAEG